jgi:hypothetical protein
MSRKQRRRREKRHRHADQVRLSRGRVAAGAGLSLGAALGMTSTAEAVDFTVANTTNGDAGSLRSAVTLSQQGNGPIVDRIVFQSGLSGQITLTTGELPTITEPLEVVGPGADVLSVSGNNVSRIFYGTNEALTISGLTLRSGSSSANGGAISHINGSLTIRDSTISGNASSADGGGIYKGGGDMTIVRSTVSGNTSGLGAGFRTLNVLNLSVQDSTISGNVASSGASIRQTVNASFEGSTVSGNSGPGIYGFTTEDINLTSTIVANNSQDILGGGADIPVFNTGFSLIENASGAGVNPTGPNIIGVDPQLALLGPNGGATATHLPATASPVIDKGTDTGTDQRGLARPFDVPSLGNAAGGNGADIGAVELQSSSFPAAAPPPQTPAKKKCKKKKKKKKKRSAAAAKKCKKKKKKK